MPIADVRSRLRDESGMTLVEVLTSAILLVVISLGVTKGIDAASNASGGSKLRTVAAMLAQEDQERMRSFSSPNLEGHDQTRVESVRGVPFTVVSKSAWIADSSGTESCGQEGGDDDEASYMRITSTVTWETMGSAPPVVHTSLVAPPNGSFGEQGSLLVEIVDRDGEGLAGVPVDADPLAGTGTALEETTGASGCAFFGYLQPINYRISFALAGHVDPQGNATVVDDVGVSPGATNRASFLYDRAGAIRPTVVTQRPTQGQSVATAESLTIGHSGLAAPGIRTFPALDRLEPIFPFASSYDVYSGNCLGASPRAVQASAFVAVVDPGEDTPVQVREVGVRVSTGSNSITRVRLVHKGQGCALVYDSALVDGQWLAGDSAVPYGVYDVCIRRSGSGGQYRRLVDQTLNQTAGHTVDASGSSSWSSSSCM